MMKRNFALFMLFVGRLMADGGVIALAPSQVIIAEHAKRYEAAYSSADTRRVVGYVAGALAVAGGGYFLYKRSNRHINPPPMNSWRCSRKSSFVETVKNYFVMTGCSVLAMNFFGLIKWFVEKLWNRHIAIWISPCALLKRAYSLYKGALFSSLSSYRLAMICNMIGDAQLISHNELVSAFESFAGSVTAKIAMADDDERVQLIPLDRILCKIASCTSDMAEMLNNQEKNIELFRLKVLHLEKLSKELNWLVALYLEA